MSMLFNRIVQTGQQQTTVSYAPNTVVRTPPEPGNIDVSGMPYPKRGNVYGAARVTPLINIRIFPGVVSYEDQQPLADPGASALLIPEQPPNRWGQLYSAGRIY